MTIGERIKNLRLEEGLSQIELAEKIHVSKQTLYKYENNIITNIPSDKIESIAKVLNTTPSMIMGWISDQEKEARDQLVLEAKYDIFSNLGYKAFHLVDAYDLLPEEGQYELLSFADWIIDKYHISEKTTSEEEAKRTFFRVP